MSTFLLQIRVIQEKRSVIIRKSRVIVGYVQNRWSKQDGISAESLHYWGLFYFAKYDLEIPMSLCYV